MFYLWLSILLGCTTPPANTPLPTSALEVESWLQTSRKIRYTFDINVQWQGWVLHSSNPEQIAIALFESTSSPTSNQWSDCIRTHPGPPSLWLSSTVDTLTLTERYASQLDDTLPIVQVQC